MNDHEELSQVQRDRSDAKYARKRAQNRLSQQCRRERISARERHLQHALAPIQSASNMDYKDRHSVLLQEHLKLIDENECLRESLLGLRKRFFSLSNAAAAAAEDPVFEKLLGKGYKKTTHSSGLSPQSVEPEPFSSIVNAERHQPRALISDTDFRNMACESLSSSMLSQSQSYSANVLTGQNAAYYGNNLFTLDNSAALSFDFSTLLNCPPCFDLQEICVCSPTEFADKVLIACRQYLKEEISPKSPGLAYALTEVSHEHLSKQIAAAAIQLLSRAAGVEPYVYHIGRAGYLEKILMWRLSALPEDSAAIPQPFTPTRLQHRQNAGSAAHHLLVDFICWPEIRDQVILNAAKLDLDELQRDITLNTVFEAPQYGAALSLFDSINSCIYNNQQFSCQQSSTYVRNVEWIFFKAPRRCNSSNIESDPVESAILQELKHILQQHAAIEQSEIVITGEHGMDDANRYTSTMETMAWCVPIAKDDAADATAGLGADIVGYSNVRDSRFWKLSKAFARKYPMIECSSAISKYETTFDLNGISMLFGTRSR